VLKQLRAVEWQFYTTNACGGSSSSSSKFMSAMTPQGGHLAPPHNKCMRQQQLQQQAAQCSCENTHREESSSCIAPCKLAVWQHNREQCAR
jgi:hypothetical protein